MPFQVAASSGGSAPGAVRNLRVTRVKNEPGPESEHYRDWTWTLTWDTPASDGGHPITEYGYRPVRCQRLGSWQDQARPTPRARSIKMTRARSMKTSFRHIEVIPVQGRVARDKPEPERRFAVGRKRDRHGAVRGRERTGTLRTSPSRQVGRRKQRERSSKRLAATNAGAERMKALSSAAPDSGGGVLFEHTDRSEGFAGDPAAEQRQLDNRGDRLSQRVDGPEGASPGLAVRAVPQRRPGLNTRVRGPANRPVGRHPGAHARRSSGRRLRQAGRVDLGQPRPDAVHAARLHGMGLPAASL